MDAELEKELQHKEVLYLQMVDLYPSESKYLRRLVELLLQLGKESEAIDRMRQLESLYKKNGENHSAESLKNLRRNLSLVDEGHSTINPFLSGIKPEAIQMLMKDAKQLHLDENELLIRQGDTDDSMYIVLDGDLAVLVNYQKQADAVLIHMLNEGDIIGEMAFLEGNARSASVIANTKASVLKLSSRRVLLCLLKFPEVGDYLRQESEFRRRLTAINSNTTLAKLPDDAKSDLALYANIVRYPPFSVVCHAEEKLAWVGIMISGLMRIVAEDFSGNSHVLEPIKPGEMVADMAAFQESAITGDIVTVSETDILQVQIEEFRAVMNKNPFVKNRLVENYTKRSSPTKVYSQGK